MPKSPEEAQARRAALEAGQSGIQEYSGKGYTANAQGAGANSDASTFALPQIDTQRALKEAIAALYGNGPKKAMNALVEEKFETSLDVVNAIKSNKLKKADAIKYVEEFKLVNAEELDDLTPNSALNLLQENAEAEVKAEKLINAENVKPSTTYVKNGEEVCLEDSPKPEGKSEMKSQMPSTKDGGNASDVNKSKKETGTPKPDGKANPKSMEFCSPSTLSDVNNAKQENVLRNTPTNINHPSPNNHLAQKVNADVKTQLPSTTEGGNASDTNSAKVENGTPAPQGTSNMKSEMPNTPDGSKASDTNTAKPEDGVPEPKKAQMIEEVMEKGSIGGMDKPPMPKHNMPEGMGKEHKEDGKKDIKSEIKEALELILHLKDVIEDFDADYHGKDRKEKNSPEKKDGPPSPEGKKDEPKADKKEDTEPKSPEKDKKESLPPLPPMLASYKAELVKDIKSPVDSYYVVSCNDKPCFSLSAKQANAVDKSGTELTIDQFLTNDYRTALLNDVNEKGAFDSFYKSLNSKGLVLAQEDKLPNTPGGAKTEAPAAPMAKDNKDMIAAPAVQDEISNDSTQKQSHVDYLLTILADKLADSKGSTAEDVVNELKAVFTDEPKTEEFKGRLQEKVDSKKAEIGTEHTPEGNMDAIKPAQPSPEIGKPTPAMLKEHNQMKEALATLVPKVKALVEENKVLKAFKLEVDNTNILKARTTATLEMSQKKAELGLISKEDIKTEALRLARLETQALSEEKKILENSIKMYNNIPKKLDYTKVEANKTINANETFLTSMPSQVQEEVESKKYTWSKGFSGKN